MEQTSLTQVKSSPKDVFLHLLMIVTLYVSAINLGVLFFQFINLAFPDPLEGIYGPEAAHHAIRWALAMLIVFFPAYVWVTRTLLKEYDVHAEKRSLRIRRWLIYFTLFAAGLVMLGDLVGLVYNFLEGELTVRFALKVLSVFLISGAVFWYYIHEVKKSQIE